MAPDAVLHWRGRLHQWSLGGRAGLPTALWRGRPQCEHMGWGCRAAPSRAGRSAGKWAVRSLTPLGRLHPDPPQTPCGLVGSGVPRRTLKAQGTAQQTAPRGAGGTSNWDLQQLTRRPQSRARRGGLGQGQAAQTQVQAVSCRRTWAARLPGSRPGAVDGRGPAPPPPSVSPAQKFLRPTSPKLN